MPITQNTSKNKKKRVLALLLDPEYKPKSKYALAKKAGCTPSWVIMIIKELEKKKLLKGLKVINVKALFELFHSLRAKKLDVRKYSISSVSNVNEFIKVVQAKGEYAFTTYIAENLVQKYLFSSRTDFYINEKDAEKWHDELMKFAVFGGGNIKVIVSKNDELFNKKQINKKGKTNSPWIVCIPQLISDLFFEGGPAREAGEMLLNKLVQELENK